MKNYIESWGQTFGTPDFDIRVWSVPASGSEVPGVEKIKIHNSNGSIRGCYQRMERYQLSGSPLRPRPLAPTIAAEGAPHGTPHKLRD